MQSTAPPSRQLTHGGPATAGASGAVDCILVFTTSSGVVRSEVRIAPADADTMRDRRETTSTAGVPSGGCALVIEAPRPPPVVPAQQAR
jgi:hypothetical protein